MTNRRIKFTCNACLLHLFITALIRIHLRDTHTHAHTLRAFSGSYHRSFVEHRDILDYNKVENIRFMPSHTHTLQPVVSKVSARFSEAGFPSYVNNFNLNLSLSLLRQPPGRFLLHCISVAGERGLMPDTTSVSVLQQQEQGQQHPDSSDKEWL